MQLSDFYPEERPRGFPLPFDKRHRGKLIEKLIITEPVYIGWLLSVGVFPRYRAAEKHIRWCIKRFDEKPLVVRCQSKGCTHSATRFTLYPNSPIPHYWCDCCQPESDAASLISASTFKEIFHILKVWCAKSNRNFGRMLLRDIATAKGMPRTLTEKAVVDWFHG